LNQAIAEFAKLYASEFRLVPLGILPSLMLLGVSMLLGWLALICPSAVNWREQTDT
jgi:cell division transport system permease protein